MCSRTKTKREKRTEEEVDRDQTFCLFSLVDSQDKGQLLLVLLSDRRTDI